MNKHKHAYLIMAHNQMDILKKLLEEIDYEQNDIYVHIDAKAGEIDRDNLIKHVTKSKVYFVNRMSITWGGASIVKCELRLMKKAAKVGYQYYHLLSGNDFPIKTQKQIHDFFDSNSGKEFIEYWKRDKKDYEYRVQYYYPFQEKIGRYTNDPKTLVYRVISKVLVFFQWFGKCDRVQIYPGEIKIGSQWISITNEFCQYLLRNESLIYMLFEDGIAVDELFVQTLCWNSSYKEKIYTGKPIRLIDWQRGNPYVWQEKDIEEIRNSECLFIRKVSNENTLTDIIHDELQGEKNGSTN